MCWFFSGQTLECLEGKKNGQSWKGKWIYNCVLHLESERMNYNTCHDTCICLFIWFGSGPSSVVVFAVIFNGRREQYLLDTSRHYCTSFYWRRKKSSFWLSRISIIFLDRSVYFLPYHACSGLTMKYHMPEASWTRYLDCTVHLAARGFCLVRTQLPRSPPRFAILRHLFLLFLSFSRDTFPLWDALRARCLSWCLRPTVAPAISARWGCYPCSC